MTASTSRAPVTPHPHPVRTILESLRSRIASHPHAPALMRKYQGSWESLSWAEYGSAAQEIARGLAALGIQPGDRVGLLSATRIEWTIADVGILATGAICVPVYPSSTADDTVYILGHSGVKLVIVENQALYDKFGKERGGRLPAGLPVVFIDAAGKPGPAAPKAPGSPGPAPEAPASPSGSPGHAADGLMTLADLKALGRSSTEDMIGRACSRVSPEDVATIVYTSGTTGMPKGAVLTHGNLVAECQGLGPSMRLSPADITLAFLPLAHIFARMLHFAGIHLGYTTAYAESMERVIDNLAEIRPTFVAAVPRLFEKIYGRVMSQIDSASGMRRKLALWAVSVGEKVSAARRKARRIGPTLSLQHGVADKLVLSKIRARFGGRLDFFVSGGAPLSTDIARFFDALGIEILEGYGLTETTAATHINAYGESRLGKVGRPIPGVETRIADDGEVCLRGPVVMKGYFRDDVATAAAFQDGWFLTGDIGTIDEDGYLAITDRKKDLLITAAGKNIAPQKIENLLKTIPFLSQAMVYGDRKHYLVALLTLNPQEVQARLARDGHTVAPGQSLAGDARVRAMVQQAVNEKNRDLASYETIKDFVLLDRDLTMESAELTPTLKLRRREVVRRYGAELDALYERAAAGAPAGGRPREQAARA
jgi:long-chain acyl-CoA synthetase